MESPCESDSSSIDHSLGVSFFFLNSIFGAIIADIMASRKSFLRSDSILLNKTFSDFDILKFELGFITMPKKHMSIWYLQLPVLPHVDIKSLKGISLSRLLLVQEFYLPKIQVHRLYNHYSNHQEW